MSDPVSAPPGFLKAMVASVARHVLTGMGAALVAHGVLTTQTQSAEFQDVALAVVLWGLGLWWSGMQKKTSLPQPDPADDPPH